MSSSTNLTAAIAQRLEVFSERIKGRIGEAKTSPENTLRRNPI